METNTATALDISEFLFEQPRSSWWDQAARLRVTETTYICNVVGLVDRDYEFCALVKVVDEDEQGNLWTSYLIATRKVRKYPVEGEWIQTGRWQFGSAKSESGVLESDVFLYWAKVAANEVWVE